MIVEFRMRNMDNSDAAIPETAKKFNFPNEIWQTVAYLGFISNTAVRSNLDQVVGRQFGGENVGFLYF